MFQKHKRLFGGCALPSRVARIAAGAALALAAWAALDPARGGVATLLAAVAVLIAGFAWLEGGPVSARDLTLVATLGGLAAAGLAYLGAARALGIRELEALLLLRARRED